MKIFGLDICSDSREDSWRYTRNIFGNNPWKNLERSPWYNFGIYILGYESRKECIIEFLEKFRN